MVLQFQIAISTPQIVSSQYALYPITIKLVNDGEPIWEHTLSKRFNEFVELHKQLLKETNQVEIPYELPKKQYGIFANKLSISTEVINERRKILSSFLYDLLNDNFDTQWRNTIAISEFLQFPQRQIWSNWSNDVLKSQVDNESNDWIVQLRDYKNLLESVKQMNNKDKLKMLLQLRLNMKTLKKELNKLKTNFIVNEKEYARRLNLLLIFQDDINEVAKTDIADNNLNNNDASDQLFGSDTIGSGRHVTGSDIANEKLIPKKTVRNSRRVFGETQETVGLNNKGLLQHNELQIQNQDEQLYSLHKTIQQQKSLSLAMNQELQQQNEILTQFQDSVQNTRSKLSKAQNGTKKFTD